MECEAARDAMLETLDESIDMTRSPAIDVHLAGCVECRAFAERLRRVDARLASAFVPPIPGPALRAGVLREIDREKRAARLEPLPDVLHFVGCGVATLLAAALLPAAALTTVLLGATLTLVSYVATTSLRSRLSDE